MTENKIIIAGNDVDFYVGIVRTLKGKYNELMLQAMVPKYEEKIELVVKKCVSELGLKQIVGKKYTEEYPKIPSKSNDPELTRMIEESKLLRGKIKEALMRKNRDEEIYHYDQTQKKINIVIFQLNK